MDMTVDAYNDCNIICNLVLSLGYASRNIFKDIKLKTRVIKKVSTMYKIKRMNIQCIAICNKKILT
jgi:hypothetical protein